MPKTSATAATETIFAPLGVERKIKYTLTYVYKYEWTSICHTTTRAQLKWCMPRIHIARWTGKSMRLWHENEQMNEMGERMAMQLSLRSFQKWHNPVWWHRFHWNLRLSLSLSLFTPIIHQLFETMFLRQFMNARETSIAKMKQNVLCCYGCMEHMYMCCCFHFHYHYHYYYDWNEWMAKAWAKELGACLRVWSKSIMHFLLFSLPFPLKVHAFPIANRTCFNDIIYIL